MTAGKKDTKYFERDTVRSIAVNIFSNMNTKSH